MAREQNSSGTAKAMEGQNDDLPPLSKIEEHLQQFGNCDKLMLPEIIDNPKVADWRQLLATQPSETQTTLKVDRDQSFREVLNEGVVAAERSAPPAGVSEGGARPAELADPVPEPDGEWLKRAPGLSGGLDLPGPAATFDLTPGFELAQWSGWPGGDDRPQPPAATDHEPRLPADLMDQALQAERPSWPLLDTSGLEDRPPPAAAAGWARVLDPSDPLPDDPPCVAMRFVFELDNFQKQAVRLLERRENVLVVAHTSAGKTAIAEYAIARVLKDCVDVEGPSGTRVVYTSPVKALSNQKYGELKQQFGTVGLLTGDTQLNPDSACLICTTEILRSMLYNRQKMTAELQTVILDEVHYIGDTSRGHIWEECLIWLPRHVNLLMLSATVPNAEHFANWVGSVKRRLVYVVRSPSRPVPLEHFLYTGPHPDLRDENLEARRLFCVLSQNGAFSEEQYQLAYEQVGSAVLRRKTSQREFAAEPQALDRRRYYSNGGSGRGRARGRGRGRGRGGGGHDLSRQKSVPPKVTAEHWNDLVRHLESRGLLPAIVFVLSRKRCDSLAEQLSHLDLTTDFEKQLIRRRMGHLEKHVEPKDLALATVQRMKNSLERGLGVHHAGMLPFIKETVELLFRDELVKVLFATETFATGINMPTKTVVFESLEKWEKSGRRQLLAAEYTQMSGRAGRRGKDEIGKVIIMCAHGVPEKAALQAVISAEPDQLRPHFRLTSFMLLNLLARQRTDDASEVIFRSFSFSDQPRPEELAEAMERKREDLRSSGIQLNSNEIDHCACLCKDLDRLLTEAQERQTKDKVEPGQVVVVSSDDVSSRLAVILKSSQPIDWQQTKYEVLVLTGPAEPAGRRSEARALARRVAAGLGVGLLTAAGGGQQRAPHEALWVSWRHVVRLVKERIPDISRVRDDVRERQMERFAHREPSRPCATAVARLVAVSERCRTDDGRRALLPPLDPNRVLGDRFPWTAAPDAADALEAVLELHRLQEDFDRQQSQLDDWNRELSAMTSMLKELSFVDRHGRVTIKGQLSCGVGYRQLLVTELVFDGRLHELRPAELAALLSALAHAQQGQRREEEKQEQEQEVETQLTDALQQGLNWIREVARRIEEAQAAAGLETAADEGCMLNFGLVPAVYRWAQGEELSLLELPMETQQGDFTRTVQRLDETLRDVRDLAQELQWPLLLSVVRRALEAIRRGIPFRPSLHTFSYAQQAARRPGT